MFWRRIAAAAAPPPVFEFAEAPVGEPAPETAPADLGPLDDFDTVLALPGPPPDLTELDAELARLVRIGGRRRSSRRLPDPDNEPASVT
jgi:hypothetical protein